MLRSCEAFGQQENCRLQWYPVQSGNFLAGIPAYSTAIVTKNLADADQVVQNMLDLIATAVDACEKGEGLTFHTCGNLCHA